MWRVIGIALIILAVAVHSAKSFEGFANKKPKAKAKAKPKVVPKAKPKAKAVPKVLPVPAASKGTPLYLLNHRDNMNIFMNNTQIAVKTIPGPHSRENNEKSFNNPVDVGMKITWPTNISSPATITGFFLGNSNPDSIIHNVIYITLDKPVDPKSTVFYLTNAEGLQNMAPASVIKENFQSYQNPYNSSPSTRQTLEFRLGQNSFHRLI